MIKYVNFDHLRDGVHMFVITMFRTPHGNCKVEVSLCDTYGTVVSDPVA